MSELGEIFDRDPLSFTKDDEAITKIIEFYRGARAKYNQGDMKAGAVKKTVPKALQGDPSLLDKLEVKI